MIIRIYLHIYVAYYHRETKQTNGGGDCGGIVATAVTVAVMSCDAVESECGIPYQKLIDLLGAAKVSK